MSVIPTFWRNAIDAANVFLSDEAREDLSMLAQGDWRSFLYDVADRQERSHGRLAAEKCVNTMCEVLGPVSVWIRATARQHEKQGRRMTADTIADLVLFFARRIENAPEYWRHRVAASPANASCGEQSTTESAA